jgi:hypothetical protein
MQIASTNSGLPANSRLPTGSAPNSALVPAAPRQAAEAAANSNESQAASASKDARALQQVAPPLAVLSGEASRALVLARQRADVGGSVQADSAGNAAAAQRALAAYNTVAGQEQRFELDEVLVGVDVYA